MNSWQKRKLLCHKLFHELEVDHWEKNLINENWLEKHLWALLFLLGSGGALFQHFSKLCEGGNRISVISEGLPEMSDLRFWYVISAYDSAMLVPFMCSCWEMLFRAGWPCFASSTSLKASRMFPGVPMFFLDNSFRQQCWDDPSSILPPA